MATSVWLAATKLAPPARRHDALLRPRLIDELAGFLRHARLILISAPAGAGKTTLLAELPHAFPETTWAWLLLDEEDNDPSRFSAALAASLASVGISIEEDVSRPSDARSVVTAVLNRITQCKDRQVAIVIDDLHAIEERSVHELLDYFIDRLPSNLRIVLGTRHDPPMALARRASARRIGRGAAGRFEFHGGGNGDPGTAARAESELPGGGATPLPHRRMGRWTASFSDFSGAASGEPQCAFAGRYAGEPPHFRLSGGRSARSPDYRTAQLSARNVDPGVVASRSVR
ncbi:MAG: AAA family ATPase [Ignavibacteriota bacterium]